MAFYPVACVLASGSGHDDSKLRKELFKLPKCILRSCGPLQSNGQESGCQSTHKVEITHASFGISPFCKVKRKLIKECQQKLWLDCFLLHQPGMMGQYPTQMQGNWAVAFSPDKRSENWNQVISSSGKMWDLRSWGLGLSLISFSRWHSSGTGLKSQETGPIISANVGYAAKTQLLLC